MKKSELIAQLNDVFRKTGEGGKIYMTRGIACLDREIQTKIIEAVRDFNEFTKDNDPYGEHDFGIFKIPGKIINWKIDCYDLKFEYGSENPADSEQTRRVLTIMLAEEY